MRFQAIIFLSSALLLVVACKNDKKKSMCQYKLNELLAIDTPEVISKVIKDTIIEAVDKTKDSTSFTKGSYTFDKKMNLRFYAFFINKDKYRYSEEYDSIGNLIKKEGSPLVEYRLWKQANDTILFNVFLFALQKRYEDIEVVTNIGDTIIPKYLYKSYIYTNVKCFAFKLKTASKIQDLVCYTSGTIQNTCTLEKYAFKDTTIFKNVRFD